MNLFRFYRESVIPELKPSDIPRWFREYKDIPAHNLEEALEKLKAYLRPKFPKRKMFEKEFKLWKQSDLTEEIF